MIFGILLILLGGMIAAPAATGAATDFHLFAALNVMGLGAICCTAAYYLRDIRDHLRRQTKAAQQQEKRAAPTQPVAAPSKWEQAVAASRGRGI